MAWKRTQAIAPIVIGVLGTAILLMLGAWQTQRLAWKESLIAEIEQKISAEPVELPESPDQTRDNLLRVKAVGILGTHELHVIHSIKLYGPGYRLIAPMQVGSRRIMVDLGFLPEAQKDEIPREGSSRWDDPAVEQIVTGLLAWPNEADGFTPEPDLGRNIWFARDVAGMSAALNTEPLLIVAESHADDQIVMPQPPGVNLPNRHLEYALTWFGLAFVWAAMSVFWLRSILRQVKN